MISYTMLLIICVEILLHIGSHFSLGKWRRWPRFPTKLAAAAASFSYKIGGGSKDLATLLVAVLTWSGYWVLDRLNVTIGEWNRTPRLENTPLLLSQVLALEFQKPLMRRDYTAVMRRNCIHTLYFSP